MPNQSVILSDGDVLPTHLQISKHAGFESGVIHPHAPPDARIAGAESYSFLATPPTWTEEAKCLDRMDDFFPDRPRPARAAFLCHGCPVIDQCLAAALEEEGGAGPRRRWGIRGGLTPSMRYEASKGRLDPDSARLCRNGHERSEANTRERITGDSVYIECAQCERDRWGAERSAS